MDPTLLIKLVKDNWRVVLFLALLSAAFGAGVTVEGWRRSGEINQIKADWAAERAKSAVDNANRLATAENEQRAERLRLATAFSNVDTAFNQERINAQIQQDKLIGDLRNGVRRLSIAVTGLSGLPGTGPAAAGTGMGDGTARAELDPAAAERIIAITNDGDDAIRQLMACQQLLQQERAK